MDFIFNGFEPAQIIILCIAAVLIGINKTGIPGLGLLPVTMLALSFPVGLSTGIQLLMLAMADIAAVVWYRKHANWRIILRLLPAALAGIGIGVIALRFIDGNSYEMKVLVGGIILALCVITVIKDHFWSNAESIPHHWGFALAAGLLAGFTTLVANAAGPIMALYLLSMRLEKNEYMGTGAWYFLILNWLKVPIFVMQGRITYESMVADFAMIPLLAVGAFIGIILLHRIPQKLFERIVLILSALAALKMLF